MTIDRRALLGLLGAGAAASGCATTPTASTPTGSATFQHGVASGDPRADSLLLWTRVTPAEASVRALPVAWRVWLAGDETPVAEGVTEAAHDRDYTVKVVAEGLRPGQEYHYDFGVGQDRSPEGRSRTLPVGATSDLVMAVVSCQLYPGGLFNAYDDLARQARLDAVIHLGDYIYEYGAGAADYGIASGARLSRLPQPPHEIVTLDDYRLRHAQYKSDPDLQAAHARAAFICVWDDHEITNDAWTGGAENHQPETEGDFATRKAAALRAYYEWMPIRVPERTALPEAVNRSFDFGDLATLAMVETRLLARGEPLGYATDLPIAMVDGAPVPDVAAFQARRNSPSRDLLGSGQLDWLTGVLQTSREAGRPWQVIGNQVIMARVTGPDITRMASPPQLSALLSRLSPEIRPQVEQSIALFKLGVPFNLDSWEGYPAGRERLYAALEDAEVQPIVLAGDSHAFWINDLRDAAGKRRAVEFGTSSVSSPSPGDAVGPLPLGQALMTANEEVVFCDQTAKGYILLTLTPERAEAQLRTVSTIFAKPYVASTLETFVVDRTADGLASPVRL